MTEDAAADRPFIAAMVISKARGGLPGPGFFDCAARLGRFSGDATGLDAWAFHAAELHAAVAFWASALTASRCSRTASESDAMLIARRPV